MLLLLFYNHFKIPYVENPTRPSGRVHVDEDVVAKFLQVGGQRWDSSGVVDQEGISLPDLGRG
jgi:hypothetical protein